MLRFCKDDKNGVGYIVVYDLSRFARNMLDQLSTEKELRGQGVRLESVVEPADDTAVGRMQRNMQAVWNQFDNEKRSKRTIVGMTQAARNGRFPFKAPIGYINVSQHRGQNLMPDAKGATYHKSVRIDGNWAAFKGGGSQAIECSWIYHALGSSALNSDLSKDAFESDLRWLGDDT